MPPLAAHKAELHSVISTAHVAALAESRSAANSQIHNVADRFIILRAGMSQKSRRFSIKPSALGEVQEFEVIARIGCDMINLVDFLKNVSEEQSMIRVSDMKILPTPDRRYLKVDLTFIASFPKKAEIESKPSKKGKKK